MVNYKMILQYDGTRYNGWQKQGNTDNTIQGRLEAVASRLLDSPTTIHGSGRTDAGVHALGQTANFHGTPLTLQGSPMTPEDIRNYFNEYLPLDIRVTDVSVAAPRFHARLNANQKHYRYTIDTGPVARVFDRKYVTRLTGEYDLQSMKKAATFLIGEHDFRSFCENKHMKKSTVRTLHQIKIQKKNGLITLDFYGNGFLYHMVRILTGTLLEVGEGKRKSEDIPDVLNALSRPSAGFTAPPQGLCLVEATYG